MCCSAQNICNFVLAPLTSKNNRLNGKSTWKNNLLSGEIKNDTGKKKLTKKCKKKKTRQEVKHKFI